MNFDNFDGIDIVDKISLLRNCKSAERNIMISPYNAIANSMQPLNLQSHCTEKYNDFSVQCDCKFKGCIGNIV